MKLIVGLGNPGQEYAGTRHNIGFSVVKALARRHKVTLKKDFAIASLSAKARICGEPLTLALPLTYMNLSGTAVSRLLKRNKADKKGLLVICDDLDLEFGRIRLRPFGSSAGHKGVQSIIGALETNEFARLRIGIGRPDKNTKTADYVLSVFEAKEKELLKEVIEKGVECCEAWASSGITETMNIFNNEKGRAG